MTDAFLLGIILLFIHMNSKIGKQTCGIPVAWWLEIFFSIIVVRSLYQLMKIYVIKYFYSWTLCYDVSKIVMIDGFMIGWLIYGNIIYYSPENNCALISDTHFQS